MQDPQSQMPPEDYMFDFGGESQQIDSSINGSVMISEYKIIEEDEITPGGEEDPRPSSSIR